MTWSPRRRRAKRLTARPDRAPETNSGYETRSRLKRFGKPTWLRFLAVPVLPIWLISGVHLQVELTPAALLAALLGVLDGARGTFHRPRT